MTTAASLFDAPPAPVLPATASWVTDTLFGEVAVILCILAIAFVGIQWMSGRLAT